MKRLPKETLLNAINTYKTVIEAVDGKDTDYCPVLDKVTVALLEELKSYRDAEEQGLLIKLPCKIGTKVYRLIDGGIHRGWYYIQIEFDINDLKLYERGLLAFTKEEAEQKLESMKGE